MAHTLIFGVRGSNPVPADAKLTPVLISSILKLWFKYGGTYSLTPTYLATLIKHKIQSHVGITNKHVYIFRGGSKSSSIGLIELTVFSSNQ